LADDRRWVGQEPEGRGLRVTPKAVGVAVLVVIVVVLIAQNTNDTKVDILFLSFTAGLWVILTITALLGVGIGLLLGRRRYKP
jgi:uncharacterized integral membrane protein